MQLKDVTPIIKAILEERDRIPRIIDQERYIPNPQPYHDGNFMRGGIRKALRIIEQAPVVDAVPVRHGRWIDEIEPNAVTASGREVHIFRCSACDFTWANKTAVLHYFKYCPNCGAKMDGKMPQNVGYTTGGAEG